MSEDISFDSSIPAKKIEPVSSQSMEELKQNSIRKLEQKQMDKQVRAEAGITEIPKEPEAVPKELPQMVFKLGSKAISCPRFELDDEEAKTFAKHLSIIIGAQNSKIYSIFIIIVIILGKVWTCYDSVMGFFGKKKQDEKEDASKKKNVDPAQKEDWL